MTDHAAPAPTTSGSTTSDAVPDPAPRRFAHIEELFAMLGASPRPAVVWYGPGDQRVELSGRVLENWIAKSANLLTEELDAEPGTRMLLAGPPHWRSLAVGLAAVRMGAFLLPSPAPEEDPAEGRAEERIDLWAGFVPDERTDRAPIAVFLGRGALAMAYDGDPAHLDAAAGEAVDFCASIRSFADSYDPLALLPGSTLVAEGTDLDAWLLSVESIADRAGNLDPETDSVALPADGPLDAQALARCAGVMAAGRAVVMIEAGVDAARRERILAEEKTASLD